MTARSLAWDDTEWQRDELLIQADAWLELRAIDDLLDGIAGKQADELRRQLDAMMRLRSTTELRPTDRAKVDAVIADIRAQLHELRVAFG